MAVAIMAVAIMAVAIMAVVIMAVVIMAVDTMGEDGAMAQQRREPLERRLLAPQRTDRPAINYRTSGMVMPMFNNM
jgi:hypothetical protein